MALQLPSEIVAERFLPTARTMLASELNQRGMTQREIAERLGVAQASVSKYVNGEVTVETRFREDDRMQETIDRIATGFVSGTMDEYEALGELLALVREFEDRGPICDLHEELMPELQGLGCDLCVRGLNTDVLEERTVLSSVRKAGRHLSDIPGVVDYVPNVGTNVGMALPDAIDPTDVAAIPGRIHALRGRIHIPSQPEFGASEHVAQTILSAATVDATRRGAINVATRDPLLAAARERGIDPLAFDATYENRADRLQERFEERGAVPRVIYHEGDFGIEPITYVFGETALDAAERLEELITTASQSQHTP